MAQCSNCGSTILFGGKKAGEYRFCSKKCLSVGQYMLIADQIPEEVVSEAVRNTHNGSCPKCRRDNGLVDVHTSYKVWSALYMTSWVNTPQVSCKSCGIKSQLSGVLYSLILGWWGIPFGIIMTPVQIGKNIMAIFKSADADEPSEKLHKIIRINMGRHIYLQQHEK